MYFMYFLLDNKIIKTSAFNITENSKKLNFFVNTIFTAIMTQSMNDEKDVLLFYM